MQVDEDAPISDFRFRFLTALTDGVQVSSVETKKKPHSID